MTNTIPREREEVAEAFRALERAVGIGWQLKGGAKLDALAEVVAQGRTYRVGVELKRHVRRSMVGALREQLEAAGRQRGVPVILCTDYLGPNLATVLRSAGIQFVDKAGNAWLSGEGLMVCIQGLPKPGNVHIRERTGRAFQAAGVKLLFELLRNPQNADRPYRELAGLAGISLFAVKQAMDDLEDKGYLDQHGKARRLVGTRRLLDEWCVAYRDRLRPGLVRARYQAAAAEWWQRVDMAALPACWGGETAAAVMGLMRRPQVYTVYYSGNVNALIAAGRLQRQDDGNVELLETFWQDAKGETAPDLLVYADLMTSGVERNIETARELYGQRLAQRFA